MCFSFFQNDRIDLDNSVLDNSVLDNSVHSHERMIVPHAGMMPSPKVDTRVNGCL